MSKHNVSHLNNLTLILNASYLPLGVCNSKRAICLYFLDKVDILMNYDYHIHSPSMQMKVPSVIKLKKYVSFNSLDVVLNRKNLLMRDHSSCQYCGSKSNLTIDHIIPRKKGGEDSWENLVAACSKCNTRKGDTLLKHSGMKLYQYPYQPSKEDLHRNGKNFPPNYLHKSWMDYLYWDVELEA